MLYIISLVCGYVIGSLPTAYLVVKQKTGADIRESGSGNVGGFNAFRVTNSKLIGYLVGVLDGLKGLVVVLLVEVFVGEDFWLKAVGLFGSVLGHNYPVWLGFKGGRGLATACGGLFLIGVSYTIVWCSMWMLVYRLKKDILLANVFCVIVTPIILAVIPGTAIQAVMVTTSEASIYVQFSIFLSIILLFSHIDVLKTFIKQKTA
ncbi:MAG: glycerol-3-phosphate acyltransferase [Ignavibacteriales bacterium]|nr:glycerol-3-phosphate acyltransferase [Ignavibacteriales bacterium]